MTSFAVGKVLVGNPFVVEERIEAHIAVEAHIVAAGRTVVVVRIVAAEHIVVVVHTPVEGAGADCCNMLGPTLSIA